MTQLTKQSITHWILTILIALVFVAAGGAKLAGVEQVLLPFERLGMPLMAKAVGLLEIIAAVALFIPKLRFLAALALSTTMVGAIGYHLTLDPERAALPGVILLILCGVLARMNRAIAR